MKNPRIFQGPINIAGNAPRLARLARQLGLHSEAFSFSSNPFHQSEEKCINLRSDDLKGRYEFAKQVSNQFDVFHFHFLESLLPRMRDLELLKKHGKTIIHSYWGSDQRTFEWILYNQAKFLGFEPPKPHFLTPELAEKQDKINDFADVVTGFECIPRGAFAYGMVNKEEWDIGEKESILRKGLIQKEPGMTYFLHSPSNEWKKGTHLIRREFELLQRAGLPIKLILVQNLPLDEAKQLYAYADFAIDQVGVGMMGLFGLECMLWEIPVLCYMTPLFDKMLGFPPILKILRSNFRDVVEFCIQLKQSGELEQYGWESRNWVSSHADIGVWSNFYRTLWIEPSRVEQKINQGWFREVGRITNGELSEFYMYIKDENVFPQLQFKPDKRLYRWE